jgi:hypothetical protein
MKPPAPVRHVRGAWSSLLLSLALVAAGIGAGQLLTPAISRACTCFSPSWSVTLAAVESEEGSPAHAEHWPAEGDLSVSMSGGVAHASLSFRADDDRHVLTIGASGE